MTDALIAMLPMMLGAAVMPGWIMVALLLLHRPDGIAAAGALVGAMTVVRLVQGVVFSLLLVDASAGDGQDHGVVVSTVLFVMGILMLTTALREIAKAPGHDNAPPGWLARLDKLSPLVIAALGAALIVMSAKQWIFTLGAIGSIHEQRLGLVEGTLAYLAFVAGAEIVLWGPLLLRVVAPDRTRAELDRAVRWLETHERSVLIGVSILFGSFFLWQGGSGLAG